MTTTNELKQQRGRRMQELFSMAKKRYLEAGGDPNKSVHCNDWLTKEELKEFLDVSRYVVTDEEMEAYIKKQGTWRDRFAKFKEKMR